MRRKTRVWRVYKTYLWIVCIGLLAGPACMGGFAVSGPAARPCIYDNSSDCLDRGDGHASRRKLDKNMCQFDCNEALKVCLNSINNNDATVTAGTDRNWCENENDRCLDKCG